MPPSAVPWRWPGNMILLGGWYLQPDCNMPSGESFVRQIQAGRRYFREKFGQEPTTAVNVDPFGHSAGLVQILRKTGYDSYLICRPGKEEMEGPVLVEVEALLKCRNSVLKMNYRFYREDTAVDLRMTLWFCEKDRMVKFHLPLAFSGSFLGQTAYGAEEIAANGQEAVRQKWVAFKGTAQALGALNNGTYGLDCEGQELHLTLIRGGAAYAAHPIAGRPLLAQDRLTPRMDQGQREFSFRLFGGAAETVMRDIERQALLVNEEPFALQMFPGGGKDRPQSPEEPGGGEACGSQTGCDGNTSDGSFLELAGDAVVMSTLKKSPGGLLVIFYSRNRSEYIPVLESSKYPPL